MGSYSYRDQLAARERNQWIQAEEQRIRDAEDRQQYEQQYLTLLNRENARTPPALKQQPLSFEEWRGFIDQDEPDPALRGLKASSKSLWKKTMEVSRDKIASEPLLDPELQALGYDLRERAFQGVAADVQFGMGMAAHFFRQFMAQTPAFDKDLHLDAVTGFLDRNCIYPTVDNIARTFSLLCAFHFIQPKQPAPEPNPALNKHGVNLGVEPDPDWERQQQRRDYYEKIVVTDPRDRTPYTQYQLDRLPADEWKRLTMGEFANPRISHVIKPVGQR